MFGDESHSQTLRQLTSIELFKHQHYYSNHPYFEEALERPGPGVNSVDQVFKASLSFASADRSGKDTREQAVENEAILNYKFK